MTTSPSMEERMARVEGAFQEVRARLATLETDLRSFRSEVMARIDRLEERMGRTDERMDRMDQRIDRLIYWQMGLLAAIGVSIIATIVTRLL